MRKYEIVVQFSCGWDLVREDGALLPDARAAGDAEVRGAEAPRGEQAQERGQREARQRRRGWDPFRPVGPREVVDASKTGVIMSSIDWLVHRLKFHSRERILHDGRSTHRIEPLQTKHAKKSRRAYERKGPTQVLTVHMWIRRVPNILANYRP